MRVLSYVLLVDVLLDQFEFLLPSSQAEERVIAFEQSVVNRSNEFELSDLAGGNTETNRFRDLEHYFFVLQVAWDNEDTKSPDEVTPS